MSVNVNEARDTFSSLGIYYELDVCHPPNTYIEVLTPNVAVSGKRALKEVIKGEPMGVSRLTGLPGRGFFSFQHPGEPSHSELSTP
ncbi:uncharacterized protein LOC144379080 isoform X4 [Halichoerus grypus]